MIEFEQMVSIIKEKDYSCDVVKTEDIKSFIFSLTSFLYPNFGEYAGNKDMYLANKIADVKSSLKLLLHETNELEKFTEDTTFNEYINKFFDELPKTYNLLSTDLQAIYDGDPAAHSTKEILACYPGFRAIFIQRIAHILYNLNVPVLPRMLTECVHSITGIDIHPGAQIGSYFCIDHGTGIVIGETAVIGDHVKIYQGVTLGAHSLSKGQALKGTKRHPTILDYVKIYSGASIFGGTTVIGNHTTIGSNTFITESIDDNMLVTIQGITKKRQQ